MMTDNTKTRREFLRDSAAFAAGAAITMSGVIPVKAKEADTSKILNYNPNMEYRRQGSTNLMFSASGRAFPQ
ncbi:MAG: twin-arginine translocation signal domain-containing protein [Planctomycetota bacterium]|jgi:hypothetical protein